MITAALFLNDTPKYLEVIEYINCLLVPYTNDGTVLHLKTDSGIKEYTKLEWEAAIHAETYDPTIFTHLDYLVIANRGGNNYAINIPTRSLHVSPFYSSVVSENIEKELLDIWSINNAPLKFHQKLANALLRSVPSHDDALLAIAGKNNFLVFAPKNGSPGVSAWSCYKSCMTITLHSSCEDYDAFSTCVRRYNSTAIVGASVKLNHIFSGSCLVLNKLFISSRYLRWVQRYTNPLLLTSRLSEFVEAYTVSIDTVKPILK